MMFNLETLGSALRGELDLLHVKFAGLPHALVFSWADVGTGKYLGICKKDKKRMFLAMPAKDDGRLVTYSFSEEQIQNCLTDGLSKLIAVHGVIEDFLFQEVDQAAAQEIRVFLNRHNRSVATRCPASADNSNNESS